MTKIISWNINGLKAWVKKDGIDNIHNEKCNIVCLQEFKCMRKRLPSVIINWKTYQYKYYNFGNKKGQLGVCIFSQMKPLQVIYGFEGNGIPDGDASDGCPDGDESDGRPDVDESDGRVITAEFERYYIVNVYAPYIGRVNRWPNFVIDDTKLQSRREWNRNLVDHVKRLDQHKPVIICGDFNVAHKDRDYAADHLADNPVGVSAEERDDFESLLDSGFTDSYRYIRGNDDEEDKCYTSWMYGINMKNDIGWRLDYFLVSDRLINCVSNSLIRKHVPGFDHCPIVLSLKI
ncbi:unnamed protein product, partial [Oppiella nova]